MRVDRIVPRQLRVEIPREHLDMAGLVDHLGGRVVLRVDPRHRLDDLRGAEQRALLTVQELRQRPVLGLDRVPHPLLFTPAFHRGPPQVEALEDRLVLGSVGLHHIYLVHRRVPRQIARVPLRRLGLLVQLRQSRPRPLVIPGEDRLRVRPDRVHHLVDISVRDRQDRVDVVDVVAADHGLGATGLGAHGAPPTVGGSSQVTRR